METTSYFVDRSQDILEVLTGRIGRMEANEEIPADLLARDQQILKQDYDLLEFAINTVEEFKKAVKKTRGACTEYCRRVLITYNRCQVAAEHRLDALPEHELFTGMLQSRYQEDEQKIQQVKVLDEQIQRNAVAHSTVSV